MKRIVVIAREDRAQAEGGHAALLMTGQRHSVDQLTFELRLIDAPDDGQGSNERLVSPREPLASRLTDDGLEITIGPDITELPELVAGTAVEIIVRPLDVKGEFLWPDITPRARPKRRTVVARAPFREAQATVGPKDFAATAADRFLPEADAGSLAPVDTDLSGVPEIAGQTEVRAPVTPDRMPSPVAAARPGASHLEVAAVPAKVVATAAAQLPRAHVELPATDRPNPGQSGKVASSPLQAKSGRQWPALAAAAVAGALALPGLLFLANGGRLPAWIGGLQRETVGATARTGKSANSPAASEIFDLLAPEPRSPAGLDAGGVSADRALALAAQSLQGAAGQRDTAEGAFWLQRYLAARLSDPLITRALTQLGSAHAEPSSGTPDYAKAHRSWQLAGAYGDPVALCFLATLHANGLGVPADRTVAHRWHSAAMAAGGCGEPVPGTPAKP